MGYDVIQIFAHIDVLPEGSPRCEKRMIDVSLAVIDITELIMFKS